jgi:hypothetical protein
MASGDFIRQCLKSQVQYFTALASGAIGAAMGQFLAAKRANGSLRAGAGGRQHA